ncbi:SprT family zinc-dependent metalloprotease [Parvularcula sp. LCG005]|uniref:M48 family metallopeptidase n=1 Tax=Parvularcula sp. LCG005 TaxID=3078805 RepID=UPI002943D827|nr:SprT family zinc-dependent metalloprotease [Parvularcula sp. LCG005]WOI53594.1 SprT family zinc-dependent metalloprotease [Parvularcula sp. LCG005]
MTRSSIDGGTIDIEGEALPVRVMVNPRARRLILRIGRERMIRVTCPSHRHVKAALAMVNERRQWISDRLDETPPPVPLALGVTLPVRGRDRLVVAHQNASRAATLLDDIILVGGHDEASVHRRIETLLRRTALEACSAYATDDAAQLGVTITGIGVRQMTSRWGSCASDGRLSFNWRLAFAPDHVLRYVVAHEVAHRRHMDHSPKFWRVVAELDPNYERAGQWLRRHGTGLHAYGQVPVHS